VGFDLYCELLGEAAREIKGEKIISPREVEIDLKVEASIPSDYAADERQRIALYRRMNLIASVEALEELKKELEDRFGKIPAQLEALLRILDLKITALNAGVKSIKEEKDRIRIEYLPCLPAGRSKKVKLIEIEGGDKISSAKLNIAG
jgi:transcription-repair coupling factor (superfamily II helicase)